MSSLAPGPNDTRRTLDDMKIQTMLNPAIEPAYPTPAATATVSPTSAGPPSHQTSGLSPYLVEAARHASEQEAAHPETASSPTHSTTPSHHSSTEASMGGLSQASDGSDEDDGQASDGSYKDDGHASDGSSVDDEQPLSNDVSPSASPQREPMTPTPTSSSSADKKEMSRLENELKNTNEVGKKERPKSTLEGRARAAGNPYAPPEQKLRNTV